MRCYIFRLTNQGNQPKGPFTGSGRGDPDTTRGVLNDLTFGLSEKLLTALGMEPADPKRLEQGEILGAVIGPGKVKIAAKAVKNGAEEIGEYSAKNVAKFENYVKDLR